MSCGILGIALTLLLTPVLLCWSIITAVAERWHALLHGVSINISVSRTNHRGWLWVRIHVNLHANAAMRRLNSRPLQRAWRRGKWKGRENNDRFIITESIVERYSAAAVWGSQSGSNFCWSGLLLHINQKTPTHKHTNMHMCTGGCPPCLSLSFLRGTHNFSRLTFTDNYGRAADCPVNLGAIKASSKHLVLWETLLYIVPQKIREITSCPGGNS